MSQEHLHIAGSSSLTYDQAISKAISHDKLFGLRMPYQNITFVIMCLGIFSVNPIQLGLQFLEKVPNHLECNLENNLTKNKEWQPCTQE